MNNSPDIPYPIIFGSQFPKLRLQSEKGSQKFFSKTNHNLFLEEEDFDKNGTFTMGQFLMRLNQCDNSSICEKNAACPLFIRSVEKGPVGGVVIDVYEPSGPLLTGSSVTKKSGEGPPWEKCPAITLLLKEMEAKAERKFFLQYLDITYRWCWHNGFSNISKVWNEIHNSPSLFEIDLEADPRLSFVSSIQISAILRASLNPPALIPQVWLNYLPPWDATTKEKEHLEENPSRVDFLAINKGERVIIEIDDPNHYAEFNEKMRCYIPSEKRYTKNLRIERSFRREGWKLYRFSNWEIMNAKNIDMLNLISELNPSLPKLEVDTNYITQWPGPIPF